MLYLFREIARERTRREMERLRTREKEGRGREGDQCRSVLRETEKERGREKEREKEGEKEILFLTLEETMHERLLKLIPLQRKILLVIILHLSSVFQHIQCAVYITHTTPTVTSLFANIFLSRERSATDCNLSVPMTGQARFGKLCQLQVPFHTRFALPFRPSPIDEPPQLACRVLDLSTCGFLPFFWNTKLLFFPSF